MLKNVFVNNYGGSFLNPDGPDMDVSNLGQRTPLHDDEMLGVPTWNFGDTQDDNYAPVGNCGCGEAVDDEMLGVPVWNFDKDD